MLSHFLLKTAVVATWTFKGAYNAMGPLILFQSRILHQSDHYFPIHHPPPSAQNSPITLDIAIITVKFTLLV
jgi:hypothetical protein